MKNDSKIMLWIRVIILACCVESVWAASTVTSVSGLTSKIGSIVTSAVSIIYYCAMVGGVAFILGSIMKFKQHKDNPTQIPIGTPVSLLLIGAALLFLPSVMKIAGTSIFGTITGAGGTIPTTASSGGAKGAAGGGK